jgi:hypothetical protein
MRLSEKQRALLGEIALGATMTTFRMIRRGIVTLRSLERRGLVDVSGDYFAGQHVTGKDVSLSLTKAGREALCPPS